METDGWEQRATSEPVNRARSFWGRLDREERAEQLDLGSGSHFDVAQNLYEIQRINDWFGGTRALTMHLFPVLAAQSTPVRVIDAGTGGAGLAKLIAGWAKKRRRQVTVVGLDWARRNIRVAARAVQSTHGVHLVQGDARRLPLRAGAADFVVSLLLMHHFSPAHLVDMLREAYDLSRCGIVMSDLVRGRLPYLAYHLIMPFVARHRFTREDGLVSIRRAYTPEELKTIAQLAEIPNPVVTTHWPWRMTLVALK